MVLQNFTTSSLREVTVGGIAGDLAVDSDLITGMVLLTVGAKGACEVTKSGEDFTSL